MKAKKNGHDGTEQGAPEQASEPGPVEAYKARAGRRGPKRQPDLPEMVGDGVAPVVVPEIDKATEEYVKWRDERLRIQPEEKKCKDLLIALMQKHGLETYTYDNRVVTLKPSEVKLKVSKVGDEEEAAEGQEEINLND